MQASGLVFRYRWAALLVTSLAFGLMHGANPEIDTFGFWTAMPQYIIIGLIMGYIAIKDDGLELAFGMHFVNNLLSTLVVSADGTVFQTASLFRDLSSHLVRGRYSHYGCRRCSLRVPVQHQIPFPRARQPMGQDRKTAGLRCKRKPNLKNKARFFDRYCKKYICYVRQKNNKRTFGKNNFRSCRWPYPET